METFGPGHVKRILAVTDSLRIHRMSVRIPLAPAGGGAVRVVGSHLEIVPPAEGDFEVWLARLPEELGELDLGRINRTT